MSHVFGTKANNVELVSVSCSSRSSDLISSDESETQSPDSRNRSPAMTIPAPIGFEESVTGLVKDEKQCVLGWEYASRLESEPLEASAREESIAWIRKVAAFYGFQPLTAYLSISYLDRFLSARQFPDTNDWPYQLLSVACLSLAAKMEELLVPSLIDLQMEGVVTKHIFEPKTVLRMELLVLSVMGWRLRAITPFNFLAFFTYKLDPNGRYCEFLPSQASDIILAAVSDARILQYRPSCIAAAAILSVANIIQGLSRVDSEIAESWCDGLSGEKIIACCGILQDAVLNKLPMQTGHGTELHSSSSSSKTSSAGSPVCIQSTLEEEVQVMTTTTYRLDN